jgi:ankyrin repeat protein
VVEELVRAGKNPLEAHRGLPILAWACLRWEVLLDHEEHDRAVHLARLLVEHGAEVDRPAPTADDWTPLMFAAGFGQHRVIELLLERGADPSRTDKNGQKALDLARTNLDRAREMGGGVVTQMERTVALLGG